MQFPHPTTSLKATIRRLVRGRIASGHLGKIRCLALVATVYILWMTRNSFVFDRVVFDTHDLIFKIKSVVIRLVSLQLLL